MVKLKYNGPDHKILIIKTHKAFKVKDGDVFEATKEEADELVKSSDTDRIFSIVDSVPQKAVQNEPEDSKEENQWQT